MFRRHAGSVILLGGWLLMLPPVEKGAAGPGGIEDSRGNVYRALTEAPLRWVQEAAYDTARECERAKEANTLFVDLDREVIEWPAAVCKAREAHTLPLEGEGLVIVKRALADARPWCRYLFHGRDCAPGRVRPRSTRYGCLRQPAPSVPEGVRGGRARRRAEARRARVALHPEHRRDGPCGGRLHDRGRDEGRRLEDGRRGAALRLGQP